MSAPSHSGLGGRVALAGKLAVSGALLAVLFWRVDRAAFLRSLTSIPLPLFLGCLLLYATSYVLSTLRWLALLRAAGIQVPVGRLLLIYFEAAFFNLFLPTLIGGDIVRGMLIHRASEGHDAALPSILLDRVSGFAAMLLIALTALALNYDRLQDPHIALLLAAVTLLFVAAVVLLLNGATQRLVFGLVRRLGLGRAQSKLQGMADALRQYRRHPWALGQAFGFSLLLQVLLIETYSLVGNGLHLTVPLLDYFIFVPLVNVVAMIPVSIAGLGVRESGVVYFFAKAGVDAAAALGMSLIWFSLTLLVCGAGGLLFLIDQHLLKRAAG
jgi:glycosyltransferase 2 family protein